MEITDAWNAATGGKGRGRGRASVAQAVAVEMRNSSSGCQNQVALGVGTDAHATPHVARQMANIHIGRLPLRVARTRLLSLSITMSRSYDRGAHDEQMPWTGC